MNNFLARMAYWTSLGFDTSEMYSGAGARQDSRKARLKRRIGAKAFKKFNGTDSGFFRDPAAWVSALIPVAIVGVPAVLIFMNIR